MREIYSRPGFATEAFTHETSQQTHSLSLPMFRSLSLSFSYRLFVRPQTSLVRPSKRSGVEKGVNETSTIGRKRENAREKERERMRVSEF